jgi:alkanesulfonate monooxygenase SsuD/methylene tetrahydromethanopterin reductase-like flavin-dependent oxidoreductase (luciferase family)
MLNLALDIGDGLIIFLYPIHEIPNVLRKINRDSFEVLYVIITSIADDEDKAIERASKTIAFYTAVGDIYAEFLREHGYKEEVDSIREEYARNGFANIHKYVSKKMLDSLAIYGNKDECNKRFKRLASMNITPVLHLNPVYDAEQSMKDLLEAIV